jgi:Glycosyltransferase family 87/WD40-like Beta Propeller Repeat
VRKEKVMPQATAQRNPSILVFPRAFLPWIERVLLALLAAVLLWKGILPGWRSLNTDFPNYYLVARLLREGYSLDRIYDWIWLQRIKDHWGLAQPLVGFAGLTPFSAMPIVPLSIFSALAAKRLWIVANMLLLLSSMELLHSTTSLGRRRVALLCLLAVLPLRTSFLLGQMHLLVLFLLVLAYYCQRKQWPLGCGICLAIAGSIKIYPLLFGLYFLGKRQWRPLLAMLSASVLLLGISYHWIGHNPINIYATQILSRSLQGEILDPYNAHNASASALLHKLFILEPTLNPSPLLNSPLLFSLTYPLWQVFIFLPLLALIDVRKNNAHTEQLEWAALLFALLVVSPVPASYHFVAAIFPVVLLLDLYVKQKAFKPAALALVFYAMVSVVDLLPRRPWSSMAFFAFDRLWCALLLYAVFLWGLWRNQEVRPGRQRIAAICLLAAAAWTTGALQHRRHFDYQRQDLARRLPSATTSYLAANPHQTSSGYVYTAMLSGGYRVLDQGGNAVLEEGTGVPSLDQLSVAVAQNGLVMAVELAGEGSSRIAIVPLHTLPAKTSQSGKQIIADGESPAISSDGTTVAFLREILGRGTLWTVRIDPETGQMRSEPIQMADAMYDIHSVNFTPTGQVVFAASMQGRTGIFGLKPGYRPQVLVPADDEADSPAVSPDGRSIAFTKLIHNRRQLGYLDLQTGNLRMLSFGDCNASTPGWNGVAEIIYATDCGRGFGLSALASIHTDKPY